MVGNPLAIKAIEVLFNFFLKYPELFEYINKSISGDLKCSITGRIIQSIENCIMHHIILNRNRKNIDYNNLYIPDTNRHIIVPVLRKVHDSLPHRTMYLDEFMKWRKKYYK